MIWWGAVEDWAQKFAPIVYFDSGEAHFPASVDWFQPQVGYQRAQGAAAAPSQWDWPARPVDSKGDYLACDPPDPQWHDGPFRLHVLVAPHGASADPCTLAGIPWRFPC